jgi:cobalt-zinc-cadmium efflux system protein
MTEHKHTHEHHHHDHTDVKNIKVAFFLNFGFTIIEIVGGIMTNSIAIISDAVHDLGDSLSLGLAWYFQKVAKKGRDNQFTYGYKRFSLLGALINSIVLIIGSVIVLSAAIPRIFQPVQAEAVGMFWLAIVGILVNGAAVFRLKKGNSINEKVVMLHLLEDVLGWAAILVGSVFMYFFDIPILDPIMSIGISCFVLFNVYKNLRDSFRVILQAIPDDIDIKQIESHLLAFDQVQKIHDLHIWSIDGNYNILSVHIVVKQALIIEELAEIKSKIRVSLSEIGIQHATFEFETEAEHCNLEHCC